MNSQTIISFTEVQKFTIISKLVILKIEIQRKSFLGGHITVNHHHTHSLY